MWLNFCHICHTIYCTVSLTCISLSASLYSLLLTKFLLSVLFIFVITGVLSGLSVAYRGSGRSPINRRMVTQRALAACNNEINIIILIQNNIKYTCRLIVRCILGVLQILKNPSLFTNTSCINTHCF